MQNAFVKDLYPAILKSLKTCSFPHAESLLVTILSGVPKLSAKADAAAKKCISKLYGAAICQKQLAFQRQLPFDLAKVLTKLESDTFANQATFAEFLL